MSLLQKLTTGKTPAPPRVLIYSDPGVGKSSFAATAPKPVFIPLEDGLDQINCTKFPHVKDFATLIADLKAVRDEEHDFQTLVIDSLSALQNVVSDGVCAAAGAKSTSRRSKSTFSTLTRRRAPTLQLLPPPTSASRASSQRR